MSKKKINTQTKAQPITPERLIYCGPNLPSGILQRYTVYKGMPNHLGDVMEKCPYIKQLFVSVEKFTETEAKIAEKGTRENLAYQEVVSFMIGGMKD